MSPIAKFLTAILGAALVVLTSALTDGHVSTVEAVQIAVAVTAAGGVWIAANVPGMPAAKTAIAALLAALDLVATYLVNGGGLNSITGSQWANVGLAVLTALGVYVVRNRPATV